MLANGYLESCFKPYYKWITFNTIFEKSGGKLYAFSFKPYYKWITFNTLNLKYIPKVLGVLNLIINGLPSILKLEMILLTALMLSFKPYYKWITFNTLEKKKQEIRERESFKPYYKWITFNTVGVNRDFLSNIENVLNLIINGLPSIQRLSICCNHTINSCCFKPYYKWITFNTKKVKTFQKLLLQSFKPYYKWITFNTVFKNF